jgi:hypothetical protein
MAYSWIGAALAGGNRYLLTVLLTIITSLPNHHILMSLQTNKIYAASIFTAAANWRATNK